MSEIALKVLVNEEHRYQTDHVRKLVEEVGLHVDTVFPEIGLIYGSGNDALLKRLRAVEGIEKVDVEHAYQLPPASEEVPQ